jgi:hypothetical protein
MSFLEPVSKGGSRMERDREHLGFRPMALQMEIFCFYGENADGLPAEAGPSSGNA